jgi:putative ABC transport system permease protein
MWSDLRQDVTYAVRSLRRTPGFTATAVLTLALGIGANTAIFSVIDSVLLRPQPYREADRLVFLWSTSASFPRDTLTPGRLLDFREHWSSVSSVAGISHLSFNLTGGGEPERVAGSSVSSSFFDILGVRPLVGDVFHTGRADDRAVVLGYEFWVRRFAGDRGIAGRQIVLNGRARTVVGVMPEDFDWPAITGTPGSSPGPELWVPAAVRDIPRTPRDDPNQDLSSNRESGYLRAVARLNDGVTIEQAGREAEAIAARLAQQYPNADGGRGATVVALRTQILGHVERPMFVLLGGVGFVLAIACANMAGLLLARSAARRRDVAVRAALGARRARIARQVLTESTLLAVGSAAIGVLVAWWALRWLIALSPAGVPGIDTAALDARVLAFTCALAVITGVLCGLVPALQASPGRLTEDLAEGGARGSAGPRSGRVRDALVAAEIAIALVLLVGAGLLLRSFVALSRVDTGIDTQNLLTFDLVLSGERAEDRARQVAFYDDVLREMEGLPGVRSAAAGVTLPIGGDDFAAGVVVEGRPAPAPGQEPRAGFQVVTPGYFHTMGIPILEGRDFREGDTRDAAAVVLVNRSFARQHWPDGRALGRRIRIGGASPGWMTVVGVVGDIRHLGPASPPRPEFYRPHTQNPFSFMAFVVRTHGEPTGLVPSIRSAVASLDPTQPISRVNTMDGHLAAALSRPRFMSTLVAAFGGLALALAVVGIYGVMAYAVAQRTREIAIRSALGARASDVVGMILSKALWLAGIGIACGLAGALGVSRLLAGLLFGVTPTDALTYAAVALILGAVALLAAAIPAGRAAHIDGVSILRA